MQIWYFVLWTSLEPRSNSARMVTRNRDLAAKFTYRIILVTVLSYRPLFYTILSKISPDHTLLLFLTKWHLELESDLKLEAPMMNLLILIMALVLISILIVIMLPSLIQIPRKAAIPIKFAQQQVVQLDTRQILNRCGNWLCWFRSPHAHWIY